MIAVGSALAGATAPLAGLCAGAVFGFWAVEDCAEVSREVEIIRISVGNTVRMDSPGTILQVVFCDLNCTTIDRPLMEGRSDTQALVKQTYEAFYLLARSSRLTRSASRKTRNMLPPRIFRTSSAL